MKTRIDWVKACASLGFLLLGGVAFLADVSVEQVLLRAGVGALVGWLIGHSIGLIPEPKAPAKVWVVDAPLELEEEETAELPPDPDY